MLERSDDDKGEIFFKALMKNHELFINSIYVFKKQKRAELSETTTLFFKVDPQERRSRINIIQKGGGCYFYYLTTAFAKRLPNSI